MEETAELIILDLDVRRTLLLMKIRIRKNTAQDQTRLILLELARSYFDVFKPFKLTIPVKLIVNIVIVRFSGVYIFNMIVNCKLIRDVTVINNYKSCVPSCLFTIIYV